MKKRRFEALLFLFLFLLHAAGARADAGRLEISAAKSLEWDRVKKTYVARGDALAKKGDAEVRADRMTASYADANGGTDVRSLSAEGRVVVVSPPYKAYGDRAVYDVKSGDATLTGAGLRIETETESLTAKDKIVYSAAGRSLSAQGDATVLKNAQTLKADRLDAFFDKGADGNMETRKITASGHIVLTTEKETVTGDSGVYDVPSGQAELTGVVRIAQGENVLEGARATVDMKTGVSRLFAGGGSSGGRVRGVFYPKSAPDKSKEQKP
jgi:lipopolysaccharide export system protein LptA